MRTSWLLRAARIFVLVVFSIHGTISVATAQQRVAIVPVGTLPESVDINPVTERVYVANAGTNTITVIDATSHAVIDTIAVPRAGQLAVNSVTNRIYTAVWRVGCCR
jgi:YVTN family beta-propeller protein